MMVSQARQSKMDFPIASDHFFCKDKFDLAIN